MKVMGYTKAWEEGIITQVLFHSWVDRGSAFRNWLEMSIWIVFSIVVGLVPTTILTLSLFHWDLIFNDSLVIPLFVCGFSIYFFSIFRKRIWTYQIVVDCQNLFNVCEGLHRQLRQASDYESACEVLKEVLRQRYYYYHKERLVNNTAESLQRLVEMHQNIEKTKTVFARFNLLKSLVKTTDEVEREALASVKKEFLHKRTLVCE